MFINKVLEKVISGEPSPDDRKDIGSLISAVEWQCFDENHNRDSAHVLHNIIEFRVNIYAAQKMRPGGSWFPLPKRIQDTRAVINPKNKDDRCFLYAVYLGLLNLSTVCTPSVASQIRKGVREQKVTVNCSLPMPVEPVHLTSESLKQTTHTFI